MIHTSSLKSQFEYVMYHSNMGLSLWMAVHHISLWMMFYLSHSEIVISRNSNSGPEILISEMNSWYINQIWTMIEAPMGMTQQVAIRDAYSDFCYCHTVTREAIPSGRTNVFMNSDRYWGDGTSIFDKIVKIFDFIKYRWTICVCKKTSESFTNFLVMYVGDIQHIGKEVPILHSINGLLITEVFME